MNSVSGVSLTGVKSDGAYRCMFFDACGGEWTDDTSHPGMGYARRYRDAHQKACARRDDPVRAQWRILKSGLGSASSLWKAAEAAARRAR